MTPFKHAEAMIEGVAAMWRRGRSLLHPRKYSNLEDIQGVAGEVSDESCRGLAMLFPTESVLRTAARVIGPHALDVAGRSALTAKSDDGYLLLIEVLLGLRDAETFFPTRAAKTDTYCPQPRKMKPPLAFAKAGKWAATINEMLAKSLLEWRAERRWNIDQAVHEMCDEKATNDATYAAWLECARAWEKEGDSLVKTLQKTLEAITEASKHTKEEIT